MSENKTQVTEEHLQFLDKPEFFTTKAESRDILMHWMKTFEQRVNAGKVVGE